MNSISVIIPSYNSSRTISSTLDHLFGSEISFLDEIIVVDSSDDSLTSQLLLNYTHEKLRVIRLPKKTMPAVARNTGAREAKGAVLAFIDADAYPAAGWADGITRALRDHCRVGGGSVLLPPCQRRNVIAITQYFLQFNEYLDVGKPRLKKFVPSCNLFCEKELFQQVGGFPEIRAAEDTLFGLKISEREPLQFFPDVGIYHVFREDLKSFLSNQILLGKYTMLYRRFVKNPRFYYRGWWPLFLLPFFLTIKLIRISWRVFKSRPSLVLKYFFTLPVFLLGLLFWAYGFAKGAVCDEKPPVCVSG